MLDCLDPALPVSLPYRNRADDDYDKVDGAAIGGAHLSNVNLSVVSCYTGASRSRRVKAPRRGHTDGIALLKT